MATLTFVPLVTAQVPPLSMVSVTFTVTASQSFGLLTVIVPFTAHALSTKPVCDAITVYVKVALPPACFTSVLSTAFEMFQV